MENVAKLSSVVIVKRRLTAIDAKHARKYFHWDTEHKKPSLVDYLLWVGKFVTKSDYVEI